MLVDFLEILLIENMDGDSDGVPGSDMHTKKWSEYSSHGKITSSDPIDSSRSITSSSGGRSEEFNPYRNEGSDYYPTADYSALAGDYSPRKQTVKKIVIGFCKCNLCKMVIAVMYYIFQTNM